MADIAILQMVKLWKVYFLCCMMWSVGGLRQFTKAFIFSSVANFDAEQCKQCWCSIAYTKRSKFESQLHVVQCTLFACEHPDDVDEMTSSFSVSHMFCTTIKSCDMLQGHCLNVMCAL